MAPAVRLLLVENDTHILDLLETVLVEAGLEVVVAANGMRASARLKAELGSFRCVITDVNLGAGPSGWDVGRIARELNPGIPVIYITGSEGGDWPVRGVSKSVLLLKPFALDRLLLTVFSSLSRADQALVTTGMNAAGVETSTAAQS